MTRNVRDFVNQRGIKSLFHFTRLNNLPSILANGLLTNEACARAGIQPDINDMYRHDGTSAVCASISYPNYKLFYRLRCNNPGVEWVVLELKRSLLWRTRCAFSDTNAGDASVYSIPLAHRQGLGALQSMFGNHGQVERAILGIPDHYTTNPQAEVLLLNGATVDDIKGVYFERLSTYQRYRADYSRLHCYLNGGVFDGRSDYEHWK